MSKKRASADVIQAVMQEWIARSPYLSGECCGCEAPVPVRLVVPKNGCNWTEGYGRISPGCQGFMIDIIDRAKAEYDLIV